VVAPIDRESVSRFAWANFSGRGVTPWPKDRILAALARPATAQDDLRDRISTTMRAEMVTLIRDRVARHVAWSTDDARAILDRHCRPGAPPEAPQTGPLPP
jgi:hypothetical protein